MAKFVLIYSGDMGMSLSPEEKKKVGAAWGEWFGRMGDSMLDGGAPLGEAKHLTADGVADGPLGDIAVSGYNVIAADSLDAAVEKCQNHPHLKYGGQIQVYEAIDMGGNG